MASDAAENWLVQFPIDLPQPEWPVSRTKSSTLASYASFPRPTRAITSQYYQLIIMEMRETRLCKLEKAVIYHGMDTCWFQKRQSIYLSRQLRHYENN